MCQMLLYIYIYIYICIYIYMCVCVCVCVKCWWGRITFTWGELPGSLPRKGNIRGVPYRHYTANEKCILDRRKNTSKDLDDMRNRVSCRALQIIQSLKIWVFSVKRRGWKKIREQRLIFSCRLEICWCIGRLSTVLKLGLSMTIFLLWR